MGAMMGHMRSEKPIVLVLGLDNSGKTAIINCLRKPSAFEEPNVVFSVHRILANSMEITLCDMHGL